MSKESINPLDRIGNPTKREAERRKRITKKAAGVLAASLAGLASFGVSHIRAVGESEKANQAAAEQVVDMADWAVKTFESNIPSARTSEIEQQAAGNGFTRVEKISPKQQDSLDHTASLADSGVLLPGAQSIKFPERTNEAEFAHRRVSDQSITYIEDIREQTGDKVQTLTPEEYEGRNFGHFNTIGTNVDPETGAATLQLTSTDGRRLIVPASVLQNTEITVGGGTDIEQSIKFGDLTYGSPNPVTDMDTKEIGGITTHISSKENGNPLTEPLNELTEYFYEHGISTNGAIDFRAGIVEAPSLKPLSESSHESEREEGPTIQAVSYLLPGMDESPSYLLRDLNLTGL